MKFEKIVFFIICISTTIHAQYQVTIDAQILDKLTKEPIAYANIEFENKSIRTISDIQGNFKISYIESAVTSNDKVLISALDYTSQIATVTQLYKLLKNSNVIYLESKYQNVKKINVQTTSKIKSNINGNVTSNNIPLQSAIVKIKNSLVETLTDSNGNFKINANKSDIIVVDFIGMKPKEIIVGDYSQLDIELVSDGELLKEIVLSGKARKQETIDLGQNVNKKFDAIGTSVNVITSKDIKAHYNNLGDLLQGKFASLNHSREMSMNNTQGIIFDIDGMIFSPPDPIPNVDPQNIETLTVLTSLASTTKYGTLGRGGVIVIKTKTASGSDPIKQLPSALVSGNDYIKETSLLNVSTTKGLIPQLQNAKTFDDAKQIYKALKQSNDNLSIPFYLDAAEYFLKWDESYALDIFTYVTEIANDNAKALKSLAFKYEKLNKLEEARNIYQRIALLRPNDAQSYRDLALIYNTTGYYNEAMQLYKQMLGNNIENVDFTGLQQLIIDELRHLLAFHRSNVNYKDLPADLLAAKFKQDLRIVFEYNDPNAEFELQFVNPQKKFYKWSHTKFDNRERMLDEIKKGYTTEAYIIDDAEPGEWIINIEALNEEPSINPNYLKYTIYKNYGLPNETKTVKVIQLENIKQKVTLDKFMYQ